MDYSCASKAAVSSLLYWVGSYCYGAYFVWMAAQCIQRKEHYTMTEIANLFHTYALVAVHPLNVHCVNAIGRGSIMLLLLERPKQPSKETTTAAVSSLTATSRFIFYPHLQKVFVLHLVYTGDHSLELRFLPTEAQ